MSHIAIRTQGLSKQYQLGRAKVNGQLRESLVRLVTRRWTLSGRADGELIWALKDVSFDVADGEILGVVGRNGSGKSTLLKLLSRITEPTTGWAEVQGRVGSLLEVGTGFHPELSGRENVFINGAILGMRRTEIARKFDEIVSFADLEKFIDTPVKHYSSGMQTRLAFAVAAHLEPEILLVDEVLAVGDIAFQKKCLGKMDDVSRQGRTILFVSHQMNQLRRLCTRCIWLERGRLIDFGSTADVINRYEASFMERPSSETGAASDAAGTEFLHWTLGDTGDTDHTLSTFGPVVVSFFVRVDSPIRNGHHGVTLRDRDGHVMWGTGADNLVLDPGVHEIVYSLDCLPLRPGAYRWIVSLSENNHCLTRLECVPELSVETPPLGHRRDELAGTMNLLHSMDIRRVGADALHHDALVQPGVVSR